MDASLLIFLKEFVIKLFVEILFKYTKIFKKSYWRFYKPDWYELHGKRIYKDIYTHLYHTEQLYKAAVGLSCISHTLNLQYLNDVLNIIWKKIYELRRIAYIKFIDLADNDELKEALGIIYNDVDAWSSNLKVFYSKDK